MTSKKPGPPNASVSGPTRLRQIALVASDLQKSKELLTHILGTEVCYIDPGVGQWGLENFLVPVGGEIIEVVSPKEPGPGTQAGRLLEKKGDGGYMLIMQTEDAKKRRDWILEKGLGKVIWEHAHESPDGVEGKGMSVQYYPKGIAGMFSTLVCCRLC